MRPMARSELTLTIYLPAMLLAFGQGILLTTLPLYAADFTSSYGVISLIVGAAPWERSSWTCLPERFSAGWV